MIRERILRLGLAASCALIAGRALAQEASPPELQPICADRPTKSNGACTVDPGHWQIEADLVNAAFMHAGGVTTDTWLIANPTLKYGLSRNIDVELNIDPLEIVRTRDASGAVDTLRGASDLFLRVKWEFLNHANVQAALIPYVKAPTARIGIGNGAWEGGVIAPVNIKLSSALSLALQPEVDDLADASGQGHHGAASADVNLGLSLPRNLTVFAEAWGQWSFDPAGTQRQYSADIAAALGLGRDSQLDAGINFGLNSATPGIAPYVGFSHRF